MKRLLSIEWQKIWLNKSSRILLVSYFVILSFIALIASIKIKLGGLEINLAEQGIFNFPYIWHFNTYIAAILKLFLAIIMVSMVANEYTYGTLKQNLIDGLSKKEFIVSKFLMALLFAAVSTIFIFVLSLILGLSFSNYTELGIIFTDLHYLLAYFVKLTGFFSICLFLGILIKRSAFALGFLLIWNIAEGIIKGVFHFVLFKNSSMADACSQLLPLEAMSNLIKEPFTRLSIIRNIETAISGPVSAKIYVGSVTDFLIVLGWTVIFVLMSYKIIQTRDL
jgi:ABC-type transport system involved in multi-copper enzyme maturation permease subunit